MIAQIAAITRHKKQDVFIRVLDALKKKGLPVTGLILGDAITESDRIFKNELLKQIKEKHLENDIYMAGFRKNIPDYLSITDAVFVPSEEGLPLAAMEAMSAKCSVISSDMGGAHELLSAAKAGIQYQHEASEEQIADVILSLLNEPQEEQAKRVQNGYEFCRRQNPTEYKKKIESVFIE